MIDNSQSGKAACPGGLHTSESDSSTETFLSTLSTARNSEKRIASIAVLGAGTMGHGIAQVAAAANYPVVLYEVNKEALARGVAAIERNLAKGIQLAKLTEADRDNIRQQIRGTIHL